MLMELKEEITTLWAANLNIKVEKFAQMWFGLFVCVY